MRHRSSRYSSDDMTTTTPPRAQRCNKEPFMRTAMLPPGKRRERLGLTLIEVTLASGLFALVMVLSMQILAGDMRVNRLTAMQIAANNAIRAQIGELMTVSRDNLANDVAGDLAKAALYYYGNNFKGEKIRIGPGGTEIDRVSIEDGNKLVYLFGIPEPGDAARNVVTYGGGSAKGELQPSEKAVGRMVLYLSELDVMPASSVEDGWNVMWKDIGTGSPDVAEMASGFDLNRDGVVDNRTRDGNVRGSVTWQDLADPKARLDIVQFPVDIEVTFFTNGKHETRAFSQSRRVIVM